MSPTAIDFSLNYDRAEALHRAERAARGPVVSIKEEEYGRPQVKLTVWSTLTLGGLSFLGCVPSLSSDATTTPGTYTMKMPIQVGMRRRTYLVHVPVGYDLNRAHPLVVVVHGAFSTGTEMEKHSGFSALADRERFVVVYPNGIGLFGFLQHWNSGHCCGKALREQIDDVGFLAAVIENVSHQFHIDRRRIYMVGNSNGGMLIYRFAAEHSHTVAAIAPVAATIGGTPEQGKPEWRIPQPSLPVPVPSSSPLR